MWLSNQAGMGPLSERHRKQDGNRQGRMGPGRGAGRGEQALESTRPDGEETDEAATGGFQHGAKQVPRNGTRGAAQGVGVFILLCFIQNVHGLQPVGFSLSSFGAHD